MEANETKCNKKARIWDLPCRTFSLTLIRSSDELISPVIYRTLDRASSDEIPFSEVNRVTSSSCTSLSLDSVRATRKL
jgi:hypothetical protein